MTDDEHDVISCSQVLPPGDCKNTFLYLLLPTHLLVI